MRNFKILLAAVCCIILIGCSQPKPEADSNSEATKNTTNQDDVMSEKLLNFQVTGYENGSQMPVKYATVAGGGENISIGVKWQILPAAQSYALLFDDKHPVANNWVHWLVVDIPLDVTEIMEGASGKSMPEGSRELKTSWRNAEYGGPQPPVGSGDHEYVATLYALDIPKLSIGEDASRDEFLSEVESHVITQESWSGYFAR